MTFDSKTIGKSVKQAKMLLGKLTDKLDNYSVRKTATAKVEIKSKKPEKILYQCNLNFDKETSLIKCVNIVTGGLIIAYFVLGIAKYFYKMDCKREWNQKQKDKKQFSMFDD